MFTKQFWKDAFERAIKTAAQTVAAVWVASGVTDAFTVDWQQAAGIGLFAAVASVVTSIGSGPFRSPGSPSLVKGVEG